MRNWFWSLPGITLALSLGATALANERTRTRRTNYSPGDGSTCWRCCADSSACTGC